LYPFCSREGVSVVTFKKKVQKWIKSSMDDPISRTLGEHSHLTKTQLETLLIDVLAQNFASKRLKYEEKARLRRMEAPLSRGSFNRTLKQAKINIVKSIYTLLLLGYLGILESSALAPYIEVSNKLERYRETMKNLSSETMTRSEFIKTMQLLRQELQETLGNLSNPWTSRQT